MLAFILSSSLSGVCNGMESPSKSIHESEPSLREADSPLSEEETNPSASTKESVEVYLFRLIMQVELGCGAH